MHGTLTDMEAVALKEMLRRELDRHAPAVERIVVAVSGGPDSVALLHLCMDLAGEQEGADSATDPAVSVWSGRSWHVAHFDHQLRPESAADAAFVGELAESLEVPYHGGGAPVADISSERGWNLSAGARTLRYAFLTRLARELGAGVILTGHTREDQAETVLQQLFRGTAYARGMPVARGSVLRPLLAAPRAALRAYLEARGVEWLSDPSNVDTRRMRPWLRHDILARLEARQPGIHATLARHGHIQQDLASFMRGEAVRRFGTEGLAVDRLRAAPAALQREAIAALLEAHAAPAEFALLERVREHLDAHIDAHAPVRIDVADGLTVRIAYGRLDVVPKAPGPRTEVPILGPADLPAAAPASLLEIEGPLVLRSRQPGDVIRMPFGSKKVSELLIDRKVPREARDALPLIARGGEVLWIEGIAAATEVAVEPDPDQVGMDAALAEAEAGGAAGELPVGAVVMLAGEIVARAHNESEGAGDPTAHAEVLVLRRAAQAVGRHRLGEATLLVTLEPCPMCFGATLQAHVGRVVYGAVNRRDGALGGVTDLTLAPWKRTVEVRGGVRAREASKLLTEFFATRR